MPKRTLIRKKQKRNRKHGFKKRMATSAGQAVLKRRRVKGRKKLTVSVEKKLKRIKKR